MCHVLYMSKSKFDIVYFIINFILFHVDIVTDLEYVRKTSNSKHKRGKKILSFNFDNFKKSIVLEHLFGNLTMKFLFFHTLIIFKLF